MTWKPFEKPHTKIWLQDRNGDTLFGPGGLLILETIEKTGSINGAAKELSMGYRSMWGKIRKLEQRLEQKLLITHKGGITRGTSTLTPFAMELMNRFRELQAQVDERTQKLYQDIFD